jgi:hypothetical protein
MPAPRGGGYAIGTNWQIRLIIAPRLPSSFQPGMSENALINFYICERF